MGAQLASLGILEIPKLKKNKKTSTLWGWSREKIHETMMKLRAQPVGLKPDSDIKKLLEPVPPTAQTEVIECFKPHGATGCDAADIVGAVILLGDLHRTTKVTYLFSLHNRNEDGELSYPEFVCLLISTLRSLTSIFVGFKAPTSKESEKLTSQVFSIIDTSGVEDRRITLHELLCVCYQCNELCEVMKEWDGQDPFIVDAPLVFDEPCTPKGAAAVGRKLSRNARPSMARHKVGNVPRKDVWMAYEMFCAIDSSGDKAISREEFLERMSDTEFLSKHSVVLKRVDLMSILLSRPASLSLMEFLCLLYPRLKPDDMKVLMRWCYERDAMDIFKMGTPKIRETTKEDWALIFAALDSDNSGKISVVELQDANILTSAELYQYLAMHDGDQDGEISFEEFMQVMHKKVQESKIKDQGQSDHKDALIAVSGQLSSLFTKTASGGGTGSTSRKNMKIIETRKSLGDMMHDSLGESIEEAEDATDNAQQEATPSGKQSSSPLSKMRAAKAASGMSFRKSPSDTRSTNLKRSQSDSRNSVGTGSRSKEKLPPARNSIKSQTVPLQDPLQLPVLADASQSPARTSLSPQRPLPHSLSEPGEETDSPAQNGERQEGSLTLPVRSPHTRKFRPQTSPKGHWSPHTTSVETPRLLIVERWDPENPKNFPIPPRTPVEIKKKRPPLFRG